MKQLQTLGVLFRLLAQQSFAQMLAYRLSATFIVVFGTLFAIAEIISLLVYFQFTDNVAGWDFYAFLALTATFSLIQYIYQFFFVLSHETMMEKIIEGGLDYDLIRPIDSQLLCTMKSFDYPSLINMLIPLGLLAYSWPHLSIPNGIGGLGMYLVFVVFGFVFYALLNQIFVGLSFWIERPQKLSGVPEYLFEFAKRPRVIYPRIVQVALAIVLPVIAASNVPVEALLGRFDIESCLALVGGTLVLAALARYQWMMGVRRYASAN
jgi:ABC-2 type transport system permease protein